MNGLKIVIDGRMINESGIGRYIRNLLIQLQGIDKTNEYFILHLKDNYDTLVYHNNFHKILADFRWYGVAEQIKLLRLLKEFKPDLVHFPHFNVPLLYDGKFIVTIHDLIHQHFSMQRSTAHGPVIYKLKQLGYRKVFNAAVKKANKILVPSNFVKNQLMDDWYVDSGKVAVTREAVDDKILTIVNKMNKKESLDLIGKFGIRKPYIFYVGNAHPHKNVERLIRMFREVGGVREKYPGLSLVLSGNDHYFWQRLKKEYHDKGIVYTGFISDEELVGLYKNAQAFVMPSLEEGFGIPILEAMACGCPVVSSNAGSLPEVGGDAAIYFDPENQEEMVKKAEMVLGSDRLKKELIGKGLKKYKQFSWKKLAEETLEVYNQCVLL